MVTYLLDTNVCVTYLKGRDVALRDRLDATPQVRLRLCSVVKAELLIGAYRYADSQARLHRLEEFYALFESLPFDDAAAAEFARAHDVLRVSGRLIGPNDLMIAGVALANGLTVVTHNTDEFGRVPGLSIEDWQA